MSSEVEIRRPGGQMSNRPLHFFWVVDCSGSMIGDKIATVNNAIQSCIQPMKDEADKNPNAQLLIRTLKFSSGAQWVTPQPVKIEDFVWDDLKADGVTDLGKAFEMLAAQLSIPPMTDRALPPVIVLLSDGYPTDDYKKGLEKLMHEPWGKKAVKIAISIGKNADDNVLSDFTGSIEYVLQANNAEDLTNMIKWASTVASVVSAPKSDVNRNNTMGSAPMGISLGASMPVSVPDNGNVVIDMSNIPQPGSGVVW